jgi:hypothetical protein
LARQNRRARSGRKRSQPSVPVHLYTRHDPDETSARDIAREDAADASVLTLDAPPTAVPFPTLGGQAVPTVPRVKAAPAPVRDRTLAGNRLNYTDYGYVIPELKRIFFVAATVVILLVLIAIVHG